MHTDVILSDDGKFLIGPYDYYVMNLEIPMGVEYIYPGAFCGCDYLTLVWIPTSVKEIGESAFNGCPVSEIVFTNPDACACKVEPDTFDQKIYDSCTLIVPMKGIESYRNHPVFSKFHNIISIKQNQ